MQSELSRDWLTIGDGTAEADLASINSTQFGRRTSAAKACGNAFVKLLLRVPAITASAVEEDVTMVGKHVPLAVVRVQQRALAALTVAPGTSICAGGYISGPTARTRLAHQRRCSSHSSSMPMYRPQWLQRMTQPQRQVSPAASSAEFRATGTGS